MPYLFLAALTLASTASDGAETLAVALVKGTFGAKAVPSEARGTEQYVATVAEALRQAGVLFATLSDEDVIAGKLRGHSLAILAYNPRLAPGEAAQLKAFSDAGGKVIAFYAIDRDLLALLGMRYVRHVSQGKPGDFARIAFKADAGVANLPKEARQASWNIGVVEPAAPDARVIATWRNSAGHDTDSPAVLLSPRGVCVTHVLLDDDLETKGRLMLALAGHFVPSLWAKAAADLVAQAERRAAEANRRPIDNLPKSQQEAVGQHRAFARRQLEIARGNLREDRGAPAWESAREALREADLAFFASFPSREKEFRGVWIHTAYGVADWGWEKSAEVLAKAGFNAVMPNVCFAGQGDYKSEVLAVDPRVAQEGDQVALCVAAAHKHGLEVHAWRVNYNLGWRGPKDFVGRLRAAGRLQKDPKGQELQWLCPSHPDNFKLERDAMLELACNYDLDGVHFDYIRYPGPEGCYCPGCRERFEKQLGRPVEKWPEDVLRGRDRGAYLDFRRAQITQLVAAVSAEARKLKPRIKVSAAVFNNWPAHRDSVGQDWVNWVKAGYLDFVCPMDYTANDQRFANMVRDQVKWVEGKVPVYPGIGAGTGTAWTATPEATVRQVLLTRDLGANGFMIFQYTEDLGTRFLPALAAGLTLIFGGANSQGM